MKADNCESMFFTAFVNRLKGKVGTFGVAARPSATCVVRLAVPSSGLDLYQASAARGELNNKSNGRVFRVAFTSRAPLTGRVNRVFCGECSSTCSKLQMCLACSAFTPSLFSQTPDPRFQRPLSRGQLLQVGGYAIRPNHNYLFSH